MGSKDVFGLVLKTLRSYNVFSPGTHQVITSPNRMHSEAVAAVFLDTPHRWRTNEKLMSEAMAVQVV